LHGGLAILFAPAQRADEPRPVPNLHARVSGLLVEHQRGEFAGVFIRRQIGIMPSRPQGSAAAEVQSIRPHRRTRRFHHALIRDVPGATTAGAVLAAVVASGNVLSSSAARASSSLTIIRNGPESAVRAVPAISRNRLARARRDWTSRLRATLGLAGYRMDKGPRLRGDG
jgi:hypothetical protein